jgi:uncharacterized protein YecT (DUF1311 family)
MRLSSCFLLVCISSAGVAQAPSHGSPVDALTARIQRNHELHERSFEIVEAERARAKQPLCPKAMTTLDINSCYSAELATTDANYLEFVRLLGAILRSGEETETVKPIPFDDAETAWQKYRELASKAAGDPYAGGTIRPSIEMGCRLTLTRHHIDELWDVYSDLGTR